MRAGRLTIKVREAECDGAKDDFHFCAVQVGDYGKLCTETVEAGEPLRWDEDLSFALGPPSEDSQTLQIMLYKTKNADEQPQLLGMGSLSLEGIEDSGKRDVDVALIDRLGKHNGTVGVTCRFFPSRTPGKLRDELGRDVIDAGLVSKGPRQAAKELNERSPQMSPRVNQSKERSRRRFGETSSSDEADRQSV